MRLVRLMLGVAAILLLSSCDPSGDFVIGAYDYNGREIVVDATSGPSGENPKGTMKLDGFLLGTVGCVHIDGSEALVGLDMSASIGLTALARITDGGASGDEIRLSPSGLPASAVCDADLEPGPAQPGTFVVRDASPALVVGRSR